MPDVREPQAFTRRVVGMIHSRYRNTAAADRRDSALRLRRSITAGAAAAAAAATVVIGGLAALSLPGRGAASIPAAASGDAAQLGDDGGQLQPPDQAPASGFGGGSAVAVSGRVVTGASVAAPSPLWYAARGKRSTSLSGCSP